MKRASSWADAVARVAAEAKARDVPWYHDPEAERRARGEGVHLWKLINDSAARARVRSYSGPVRREFLRAEASRLVEDHEAYATDSRVVDSDLTGFDSSGSEGVRRSFADKTAPVPGIGRVLAQRRETQAAEERAVAELSARLALARRDPVRLAIIVASARSLTLARSGRPPRGFLFGALVEEWSGCA